VSWWWFLSASRRGGSRITPGGGPGNSPLPNTLSTGRKFKRQSANIHAVNRPLRRAARPMAAIVPAYFMENRAW